MPNPLFDTARSAAGADLQDLVQGIARRDAGLHAWAWLGAPASADPKIAAPAPAAAPAGEPRAHGVADAGAVPAAPCALEGVPFGVKDVIDVAGMPTRCGSTAIGDARRELDATCVAQLRQAGAIPIGKTVTAEFAFMAPGPTRNPWRPDHTPGGSSSGSAAAVAAGMVEFALGTQTGGSVIRPAAYCGVVGFKPSFGRVHRMGMQVLCDSIDTIGWFSRTVAQAAAVACVLMPGAAAPAANRHAPRVAVLPCAALGPLSDAAAAALAHCAEGLEREGATTHYPMLDADIDHLTTAHAQIMRYELARGMLPIARAGEARLSAPMREAIHAGLAIDYRTYVLQQHLRQTIAAKWEALFADTDFILAPSAPGEAPAGLHNTGSSLFNRIWTLLGWPCIHLPLGTGKDGLPVGVQWIGRPDADFTLLHWAARLHPRLSGDS